MNLRLTFILSILLFSATGVIAQNIMPLTLHDAVALSIKNSKQLKISSARIDEAMAQAKEAAQARLPDFKISANYMRLNNANLNLKFGSNDSSSQSGSKMPTISQAIYGTANISFPIFAGGKLKYGMESAKLLAEAEKLDAETDQQKIILNTTNAYVNLYKAYEAVVLVKENLISSQSRDSNFSNLEKNGLLARNDLLKSQLQTSNIELSLLNAENDFKMATISMNLMLGLPEADSIVVDTGFVNNIPVVANFNDYENSALQNRADIKATDFRIKASDAAIKMAKAEAYPSIGLTAGYIAADIPKVLTVTNALNMGVGIQYNLANIWKSNTRLKKAEAQSRETRAMQEMLNDEIRLNINRDYQSYLLGLKKIDVFKNALVQADENFRITNNKYQNSLVTLTDLLEADVARLQAKINIALAKADLVLAYNKLLNTAGLLKAGK